MGPITVRKKPPRAKPQPKGPQRQRLVGRPLMTVALVTGALVTTALIGLVMFGLAATSGAANEVPWRDLPRAQAELNRAEEVEAQIRSDLAAAGVAADARASTLQMLGGTDGNRVESLQAWRARSRELAVERYMLGGTSSMAIQLLNIDATVDLAYRSELLASQAKAAQDAAEIYASLISDASAQTRVLVDDIDGSQRRIDGLISDLSRATEATRQAAWVVTIAEVHALADREFAQSGRRDPTRSDWVELAACESSNRWDVNTGNGFYGAYQFDYQTWFTVGGEPGTRADQAPPEEQDARARLLYSRRGSQPWPECGWHLDS